jgi:DNA-binding PadR family transcriptional regulator
MANRPSSSVEIVLSSIEFKHTLHLYNSDVNKYAIQTPFLAAAREGETAVYVTNEGPAAVMKEFEGLDIKLSIIKPEELGGVRTTDRGLRIIVDAGSIDPSALRGLGGRARGAIARYIEHIPREKYLAERSKGCRILCTYDMGKLTPDLVKQLIESHDKLVLTTSDATMLASESLDKAGITGESVERFVKDDLEPIVLALMLREPMCGTDIIKTVHDKFGVLLSPGTIYPLLHDLEKRGLLRCEYGVKTKMYKPAEGSEERIKKLLDEHVKASRFLSSFLQVARAAEK